MTRVWVSKYIFQDNNKHCPELVSPCVSPEVLEVLLTESVALADWFLPEPLSPGPACIVIIIIIIMLII